MSRIHKHTEMCWNFGEKKEKKDKNFLIFFEKTVDKNSGFVVLYSC